jgi:tetratricopeptide (TPR) repeat protein
MRRVLVLATVLGLGVPAAARGGIYNFAEPAEKFGTFAEFSDSLIFLRQINSPVIDTPHRQRYLLMADLMADPAKRGIPANLDDLDRLNLSGYLLRLRDPSARRNEIRYLQAKDVLEPLVRRDPKNFLAQSNLATAYQKLGQGQRALDTLSAALDEWPKKWHDLPKERREFFEKKLHWNEAPFQWYREAETYQRRLWLLRQKKLTPEGPDALFDKGEEKVRFVGPSGKYEAGKMAASERRKLPTNALAVVEQLLLWEPDDARLLWLAAELLNAEGDAERARDLMLYVIGSAQYATPELKEHRDVLVRETPPKQNRPLDFGEPAGKAADDKVEDPARWPANPWQLLGVGFGAGAVVALLGVWQVREIRRRRAPARP